MVVLAAVVAVLGPAISAVPLGGLRLFVGGLLLIFGLQWLRKAILRASGNKHFRDEAVSYQVALAEMRTDSTRRRLTDRYAFTLSFKGVVLEGLEVVFIALTFGANAGSIPLAALAATAAVLLVAIAGYAIRRPLSRVPENSMKFVVGVMLTAFGVFWGAEGAGAHGRATMSPCLSSSLWLPCTHWRWLPCSDGVNPLLLTPISVRLRRIGVTQASWVRSILVRLHRR